MWNFKQDAIIKGNSTIFVRQGLNDEELDFSMRIAKTDFDYLQISCIPSNDVWDVWVSLARNDEETIMSGYEPKDMLKALKIATKKLQRIVDKIKEYESE